MLIGVEARTLQVARYGVARYLVNLLTNMLELDEANRYLMYLSRPIAPADLPIPEGSRLAYECFNIRPSILWRHLLLPQRMRKDGCDVHFSPAYFVPLWKVCPYVVVVHDMTFRAHPEWFSKDRRHLFDNIFWKKVAQCEAIMTVSEHSKGDIVRYLGADPAKVRVIYEAADAHFKPVRDAQEVAGIKSKYGLAERFLLHVGVLHTRRNVPRLIEAVSAVERGSGEAIDLLFVGSQAPFSPVVDIPALAAEHGLRGKAVVVEYISEADLLLLYNACTALVYPSLYEGFGLPVLEAMACGAPVICSNTTSLPEVAGEAALYFDPYNVDMMSEAINRLWEDEGLRAELSDAGLRQAASFSWRRAAKETLALFAEIRGGKQD